MSMSFLYVFLALVLQNNSNGSVLALLGKKKCLNIYGEKGAGV